MEIFKKKKVEKENSMLIEKGNRLLTWFFMRIESLMQHVLRES
jgi:hypothetical protein